MALFKNKIDTENGIIYSIDGKREIGNCLYNDYKCCNINDCFGNKYKYSHQVIYAEGHNFPKHLWGDKQINHKDENHQNNKLANLELITKDENLNYGTRKERIAKASRENPRPSKKLYQYTIDGYLVKIWSSTKEAVKDGFSQKHISDCCLGKRKTHKGFIWSYQPL